MYLLWAYSFIVSPIWLGKPVDNGCNPGLIQWLGTWNGMVGGLNPVDDGLFVLVLGLKQPLSDQLTPSSCIIHIFAWI